MSGKLRQLIGDFSWGRIDVIAHREAARIAAEKAAADFVASRSMAGGNGR
jgi:membrane protein required for beta-lactamase induction